MALALITITGVQAQTTPACSTTSAAPAGGVADFGVSANPDSLSVVQGGASTIILSLTPFNKYSGYVTLSCSGLTTTAQCGFVPVDVFVGGTAASSTTLSVVTVGATGPSARLGGHSTLIYAVLLPGLLCLAGLGLRGRRSMQSLGMVLLVVCVSGALAGCSQRYHYLNRPPQTTQGTPLGSTTFILEAQSISGTTVITHSCTLPLTVTAPPKS